MTAQLEPAAGTPGGPGRLGRSPGPAGATGFDLAAHQRHRIRALEQRVTFLETQRATLERLLALACQRAGWTFECDPLLVRDTLIEIDQVLTEYYQVIREMVA